MLSNKQKCTLGKYPLSSWSGFCDLMIKSQLLMGPSGNYGCAHCRCYNFWDQMAQVEPSGNGILSSQHLQDFRNTPTSQCRKKGKAFSLSCFLVRDDRMGVDAYMCRRLQHWPGMSKTGVQVFELNWRGHGFESWAPPIEHYLVLSTLSIAYIHLYRVSHISLRNPTQEPKRLFLRLGCSSEEVQFFRINNLLQKIFGVEKFPPRPG